MPTDTKLTPKVQAEIVGLVRAGNFQAHAAAKAGVHRNTVNNWVKQGELEPDSIYGEFLAELRDAEAEFITASLAAIAGDPKGHKGLMWMLERRFPQYFSARVKNEVSGPDGGPVSVAHVDPDALAARIRALSAGRATAALPGGAGASAGGDDGPRADGATEPRGGAGGQ